MERPPPPPPPPPFPFPNTNSSSSQQTWYFQPSFDHPQVFVVQQEEDLFPANNFSNSPAPPHFAPQQMAAPANYASDTSAAAPVPAAYPFSAPANNYYWPIYDTSAASVMYHHPTDHYQYFTQQNKVASDALATKAARSKRKMARQKSIMNSNRSSSSSSTTLPPTSQNNHHGKIPTVVDHQGTKDDDSCIIFSDNKKLKLVFKKKLKNSDVSQLGRIVIPKKNAEENLPPLTSREGIKLVVRDLTSDRQWILKYKFWSNNKSRMYILENTGDFLRKNGLKMGDTIILYEDEHHNYFFSAERAGWDKHFDGASYETEENPPAEEEDAALAIMIENLRHNDGQDELAEANNLLTLSMGMGIGMAADPYTTTTHHASSSSTSHHQAAANLGEQDHLQEDFGTTVNYYDMTLPFLDTCWIGDQYLGDAPP